MQVGWLMTLLGIVKSMFFSFCRSTAGLLLFAMFVITLAFLSSPLINYLQNENVNLTQLTMLFKYDLLNFIYMFVLPMLFCKKIWREKLSSIGCIRPKSYPIAVLLILLALAILLPEMIFFSKLPIFITTHAFLNVSSTNFFISQFVMLPFYYFSEEFFYRGFLFTGLWHRIKWHSFWVTDIIFTAAHFGKPFLEILLCIPASIIFNILTLCTKSFMPAFIVHSTLGITLNLLVNANL